MRRLLIVFLVVLVLFLLWRILRSVGQYVGVARTKHVALGAGNIPLPQERTLSWNDQSALTEEILQHWATQELPDWQEEGKVKAPRVIMAKLALKRHLREVNDYLISAGGVHRGKRSMIVARPVIVMFNDQAQELEDVFHLAGPGSEFAEWNNTGVNRDFACAAGPVHIPDSRTPATANNLWSVYQCNENLYTKHKFFVRKPTGQE